MAAITDLVLEGASVRPLAVFSALNALRQYDVYAYAVLAPEIRYAMGTDVVGILLLLVVMTGISVVAGIGVGHQADRSPRVRLAAAGAALAGLFGLLTGLAVNVVQLVAWRLAAAGPQGAYLPAHEGLLSDYFQPALRTRVFTWYQAATTVAVFTTPALVGALAYVLGWRAPFLLLSIPTIVLAGAAYRLHEPTRGAHERRALGADEEVAGEEQTPAGFSEAIRSIFAIRSLRRAAIGLQIMASALVGLVVLASMFFAYVYRLDPLSRGLLLAGSQPFALAGLLFGAPLVERRLSDRPDRAVRLIASFAVAAAVSGAVMAEVPFLPVAVVALFVQVAAVTVIVPGLNALFSLLMPARMRSFGFAYVGFWMLPGLGNLPSIGVIGDRFGMRWALLSLAPLYGLGALVISSAASMVAADVDRAATQSMAEHEVRTALATGGRKLLLVRDLDVAYDDVQVLFGLDLEVYPGEVLALLGTNGAGKSTLLKAITGLVDPVGGAIYFDGLDVTHKGAIETFRLGVVQMPGGRSVFPTVSVADHLDLAAAAQGFSGQETRESVERVLEWLPALRKRWDQPAGNLSGGEQQMLGLAVALMSRPKLLMIDELSLGLAPAVVQQLLDVVRRINRNGVTVIIVEQSLSTALSLADRAYFLEKGEVRFCGPTRELLERGDIARAVFLPSSARAVDASAAKPAARRSRRRVSAPAPEPSGGEGEGPVLEVRGLTRTFGGITAVNEVSFNVRRDEIVGLIGPNGAGKTTIFDLISGFVRPDAGSVLFDGADVTEWAPDRRARAGLGRSFQDARIFPSLTVEENLAVSLERHLWIRDHLADAVRLPEVQAQERDVRFTADRLIGIMNLGTYRDKFVSELSTGTRRVVDLAMAIAHNPSLLILDEPSSGIAQRETEALAPLLLRIHRRVGCAILVIEHDMALITAVSDRILALELGQVIAEGAPAQVLSDPRVISSYLGDHHGNGSAAAPKPRVRRRPARAAEAQA